VHSAAKTFKERHPEAAQFFKDAAFMNASSETMITPAPSDAALAEWALSSPARPDWKLLYTHISGIM
jgi:hypothetical protein